MSTLTMNEAIAQRNRRLMVMFLFMMVAAVAVVLVLTRVNPWSAATAAPIQSPAALWESHDLDAYRYRLEVGCFCPTDINRPVVVEVRDGAITSVTYVDDGTAANAAFFSYYAPVEKLFAIIADAEAQNAVRLDVTYDETYGLPLSVDIDIDEMMADEELYLTVSDFEVLR